MQKDSCGYCGKENKGKFAKCWECHKKLEESRIGDQCFICSGLIMERDGKFGKFKTCSNWSTHPGGKLARPVVGFLGQNRLPESKKKLKKPWKAGSQKVSWGTRYVKKYVFHDLPSIHEPDV